VPRCYYNNEWHEDCPKIQKDKIFNENLILQWQTEKMAKFNKMAKCVCSWPAQSKNVKIFWNWPWNGQSGNPGATTGTWSEHLKIYCRVIFTQKRPRVQQCAGKFRNLSLQAKDRTWANCALALSVSGASRSRLCPDGPHVRSSGHAYMPSCIRPEVKLPLNQRVLCSDCCKKIYSV